MLAGHGFLGWQGRRLATLAPPQTQQGRPLRTDGLPIRNGIVKPTRQMDFPATVFDPAFGQVIM